MKKKLELIGLVVISALVLACTSAQVAAPPPPPPPPPPEAVPAPPPPEESLELLATTVNVVVNGKGIPSINPIVVSQGRQDIEWIPAIGLTNLKIEFKDKKDSRWHGKLDKQPPNPKCGTGTDKCRLEKASHAGYDKDCLDHGDQNGNNKKQSEFCMYEYTITATDLGGSTITVDPVVIIKPYP